MSRTDKDRPDWVIRHVENFPTRHNHEHGECREETLEYARAWAGGYRQSSYHHTRNHCPKWTYEDWTCTKAEPFRPSRYLRSWAAVRGRVEPKPETLCWNYWYVVTHYAVTYHHTECLGHKRWVEDESVACDHCDNAPVAPTCEPDWYGPEVGYRYSSRYRPTSMGERTHTEWHRPERRREREGALAWAKEWNAGDELEDWDFENRQARGSALWHAL